MSEQTSNLIDEIIAGYLRAEEEGKAPDRQALLEQHPELAEELREFFADRDRFRQLASPFTPPMKDHVPPLAKIRYFGDYELQEEIARGGMGVVYKARQVSLNRVVAVKMILSGHLATADDVKRFKTEAEAAAGLQHPGIVPVYEVGTHYGQHFFSMEYVAGKTLAELIRDNPLPAPQAARYVQEIAETVAYAHRHGTLHRDLKPSNVIIDARDDSVRITDFGLAMRVEGESELTRTGQILGTPSYMSPEQAEAKRGLIGPGSDIYSMGVLLYELLTDRPPFRAETAVETIRQVIETEPPSPRLLNPSVPKDLETICLKCLEKEPHKRYATAEYLADDLLRYANGEPILARPIGRFERSWRWCRRNPVVASLCSAITILLVGGTTVSTYFAIEANNWANAERDARRIAQERQRERDEALNHLEGALSEIATLNAVLKVNPNDYHSLIGRGRMYALLGMWEPASEDYVAAIELEPPPDAYSGATELLLQVGDIEESARICRIMLDRFGDTSDAYIANKVAMTCLRSPSADSMLIEASSVADRALELAKERAGYLQWAQLAKALAELRKGNLRDAIDWSRKCVDNERERTISWPRTTQAHLVMAIAYWGLNQRDPALAELTKAKMLLDGHEPDFKSGKGDTWGWLSSQPLRREAEAMILGNTASGMGLGSR